MHNCSTIPCIIPPNLRGKYYTIEKDMINTFNAMYMHQQWGVEVGYKYSPWPVVCMNFELAQWQMNNDCGKLCELSKQQ